MCNKPLGVRLMTHSHQPAPVPPQPPTHRHAEALIADTHASALVAKLATSPVPPVPPCHHTPAGLYLFRLSPSSAQLFINGVAARPLTSPLLGTATRTLPLLAGAPGVYQLQVVVANPGPPLDMMVLGPSAGERG
jgi:hypothetical protein